MRKAIKRTALSLALGFGLIGGASAATTTLNGLHTTFSFDSGLVGLFGQPTVSGDSIFFTPTDFVADAILGAGAGAMDSKRATVNITVTAKNGYVLNGINLTERGDYQLMQLIPTGILGVNLSGQIRVFDTTNPAIDVTHSIQSTAPLTTIGDSTINWTANANTSFAAWQATAVNLTIENKLLAYTSSPLSEAFIEKKYVGASALVTAVPEPETYAMFLAGLGMLGAMVRRRIGR